MSVRTLRRTHASRLARWGLLCLEDRVTPAINFWTGNAGTTNWADDSNWSEFHRPTSDDDAYVNTAVTVIHDSGIDTVKSLNMGGNGVLFLSGGSLAVSNLIEAPTDSSDFHLSGGFLVGGTVTVGSEVIGTNLGGVLSGITLAGTLNLASAVSSVQAGVVDGLTLSGGTILLGNAAGNYGYLGFSGTQTLGGTGTVVFGISTNNILQAGPAAASHLTIGPNVTVRGHTGAVGYSTGWGGPTDVTVTNQGTIRADTLGGTIAVNGTNWTNAGTASAAGGTLTLLGSWTNTGTLKSAGDTAVIEPSPTGATQTGNTVTITTTAAHGFTVGQSVTVAAVGSGYNGTFAVASVPSATTFTYVVGSTGLAPAGGGTATLNSTLNLGGTFATPTLGTVSSTGGVINLIGTLNNASSNLTLDAGTRSWNLLGGTITGGTVTTAGGARLVGTSTLGTLAGGITLAGTLDLSVANGNVVRATGGLTLDGGTVLLGDAGGNYGVLSFDGGNQTLGGDGTVVFGGNIFNFLQAGSTAGSHLTIGPDVLVRGKAGGIGFSTHWGGSTDSTFTNQGTIRADGAGGALTLNGFDWVNTGTVEAVGGGSLNMFAVITPIPPGWTSTTAVTVSGGGTLDLRGDHWSTAGITVDGSNLRVGGKFTRAAMGTLTRTGGTVSVTGTLENAGNTLALNAATGSWLVDQGTIEGGTVTTADGTALIGTQIRTSLDGVTLAGTLDLTTMDGAHASIVNGLTLDGGTILIGRPDGGTYGYLHYGTAGGTLTGTGTVVFGGNFYNWIAPGILPGNHLTIGLDVVIRGHTGGIGYHTGWGGEPSVSVTLQGTVQADMLGGTITVDNATNYANGTLTGGTWKAINASLRIADGSITTNAAHLVLDGPSALVLGDGAAVDGLAGLRAVAAGGSLTVNGRTQALGGPITNDGTVTAGPGGSIAVRHQYANSVLAFSSQWNTPSYGAIQTLGAPNVFAHGDNPNTWIPGPPDAGAEFITVGFATPDFADGVVVRETNLPGFVTKIDAIDTDNVTHTVWTGTDTSPPNVVSDFLASWPRTAYRVKAVTIHINTSLKPGWEAIDAVQLIGANTGYTQDGGTTTVAASGSFSLSSGSTFVQTGGTTTVNGTLSATVPVDIQGGLLEGTGTVNASVINGGTVNPGPGTGALTILGDYTQTAAGTLAVELGGLSQYDRLNVGGTATLNGTLDVELVNGFFPIIGDGFTPLDLTGAGTVGGTAFAGLGEGATFDAAGPTTFKVSYAGGSGNDVALTAINRAPTLDPIPDPPSTLENPGLQTINLTGIGTGNIEAQGLTVTAVSDNPDLIPNPTVTYASPNATGSLSYTPLVNTNGTATITVTVTDTGGTANGGVNSITRTFVVTVVELNDAPTLDPIPNPDGILEDASAQTINLTGISAGGGETQTLTVTATSDNTGLIPDPVVTYTSPNGTGSLSFTPVANQHGTAIITVKVRDSGGTEFGGIDEVTQSFIVVVGSAPDAPSIDTDPLTTLDPVPIRRKATDALPAGTLVSDLLTNPFDGDGEPVGIAITALDPANTTNAKGIPKYGVWQFSTDGTNWVPMPATIGADAALVLSADATTRVRFLPNLRFQGLSKFTFRAWDHSDTAAPGSQVDTSLLPTAYGVDDERAWVAVGKSKPPVNADGATLLAAVREDAKASRVFPVKTLLGLAGLESLPAVGLGIAITSQSSATGTWQYRLFKTKDFLPIDPVDASNALLLRPTDSLRFIPALNANGTGDLTFKAWVPDANFGTYVDTAGFGVDSGAAVIPITAVNDAPVLDALASPSLGTVLPGNAIVSTVAALGLAVTDADGTPIGIQVLKATGATWEYRKAGGDWVRVTRPVFLTATDEIRFTAAADAVPGTATLSFKAWDGKLLSKVKDDLTVTIG